MKRFILVILILGLGFSVFSQQIREFTSDTALFVSQFEDFMGDLKLEDDQVLEKFIENWQSDSLDIQAKESFITAANHMLRRRGSPVPHFIDFVKIMNISNEALALERGFQNWISGFGELLATSTKSFNEIQRAQSIVVSLWNDSVLYDLAGTRWNFECENISFVYLKGSPVVKFQNANLSCIASKDTMKIYETDAYYDPLSLLWMGKGGKITWEKAGLDPDMVYAELNNYKLELNKPYFDIDSVQFYYKKYFDYPLEGNLQERAIQIVSTERATFPKFFSYQSKYIIPDLFPSMEFTGGLSMQGAKLVGTGNAEDNGRIRIFDGDTLRMIIESMNIIIREKTMTSTSAVVKIFLESDSIYHPDLQFLYLEEGDEVRLTKGDSYTSGVPYMNSYHRVLMNFEELQWKRGGSEILLKPSVGRAIGQARFESDNFFNLNFYTSLQGRDYTHPLYDLYRFSNELNGWREFPVSAFAGSVGKQGNQVRQQLMKLSRLGFVYFDEEEDRVRINDKLFYYLEASVGRTDYDVISFLSQVNAPMENARLDLRNFDLKIYGVPNIFLSDSQNVVLIPDKNQIIMKRNRNFQFDGDIQAGLLTLSGSNFFFDYERFAINLQDIDSMRITLINFDEINGQREFVDIDNLIMDLTGEIVIDDPSNKSGRQDFPEYPIFNSNENSYVYFDDKSIQGGVYKRNEVFFEIYPFTLDSLDNFSRHGMNLTGNFESGGMIPTLEQTLILQADNSLGFTYKTPQSGIPVYSGKATLYNDLKMSSNGLHAAGQLDYITSTTYSDDFTFHPDSMMTNSREFMMRKQVSGTQYPKVNSTNNKIKWLTQKDEFYANMKDVPFTMFQDTITLKGNLKLTPSGLSGNGKLDLVSATVTSKVFRYDAVSIMADTSDFRLNSVSSSKFAISADNVGADIDLSTETGHFFSNEEYTEVDFPEIVYESKLDYFKWDIRKETVEMGLNNEIIASASDYDDGLTGPRYISKMPSQDSLSFVSPRAIYDFRNARLDATKVPYMQVADARIYPDEGFVSVGRNAVMKQLTNAGIVIDYRTENFEFFNSMVSVKGKYDYTASADYNYIDITGEPQIIHFTKISVDTSIQSVGLAEVTRMDSLTLSPYFKFYGQVRMASRDSLLVFDGGTQLIHDCKIGRHWLKFEAPINPKDVRIPVPEQPLTYDMAPTYIGTMITRDSTHIYSNFVSQRKGYFDLPIATAKGIMHYNAFSDRFEIASPERLVDTNVQGDYLALDNSSCIVYSSGNMDLRLDFGQVKMTTIGRGVQNEAEHSYTTRMLMGLDFYFSDAALAIFANELDSIQGLETVDLNDSFYKESMIQLVGEEQASRLENDLGLYGEYRTMPAEFNKKLIFSDVLLEWNQNTRTYRYHGDISVIKVGNKIVSKKVEVYMELTKRATGDLIDMYFVLDDNTNYYLGYNPGSIQVVSSNRAFNSLVFGLKDKERKLKVKPGTTGYIYSLSSDRRPALFLRRYNAAESQGNEGEIVE
ncbi:MAG: hypothetical protein K9H49_19995 [Bacteroidales bacterium]|nr:hypothetical protein [Bacteroidales bacterium]